MGRSSRSRQCSSGIQLTVTNVRSVRTIAPVATKWSLHLHDYRRVTFVPHTSVPFDYGITWAQYKYNYRNVCINHIGQTRWVYGLFAHYIDPHNKWGIGSKGFGFVIGNEASYYLLDYRQCVLMHEYGHVEGMREYSGGVPDIYGSNRVISYHYYHCSSWDQYLAYARSYW